MIIDPNDLSGFENTPDETLYGLSQRDLLSLCMFPFMKASPLKIRPEINDGDLDRMPFFCTCEELLAIVACEGNLKLTPKGNLPVTIIKEIYGKGLIPDMMIEGGISKSFREQEIISIAAARQVCELAGLIKKRQNKLSLTRNGQRLLRADRHALFSKILITHAYDFDTSQFDGYPDHATGQYGNHVTWYLLLKYGPQSRPTRLYAEKYLSIFPDLITPFGSDFTSPTEQFSRCFEVRSFSRFNDWWGFTETTDANYGEVAMTKQTELITRVFYFER